MKNKNLLTLACLCGLASYAHASFELMLIADTTGRIQRIDPQNEIGLGSFRGLTGNTSVVTDNSNTAYVTTSTTTKAYNIATGEAIGFNYGTTNSIGHTAYFPVAQPRIMCNQSSGIINYNISTGVVSGLGLPSGITSLTGFVYGLTGYSFGRSTTGNLIEQGMTNTGSYSGVPVTLVGSAVWNQTFVGQPGYSAPNNAYAFTYRTPGGALTLFSKIISVNSLLSTTSASFATQFSSTAMPAAVFGHDVMYLVGKSNTVGKTRVQRWNFAAAGHLLQENGSFELDFDTALAPGVGMVVAPEPATSAGLLFGLIALIKRRKSRV